MSPSVMGGCGHAGSGCVPCATMTTYWPLAMSGFRRTQLANALWAPSRADTPHSLDFPLSLGCGIGHTNRVPSRIDAQAQLDLPELACVHGRNRGPAR